MTSEEVAVDLPPVCPPHTSDMEAVQEEIEHLKREIIEANEDRAKAAEYGLVLLEEKQALAGQIEELNSLYDSARRELETAVESIKRVQNDYEKRLKDVENQREQLLSEMESRESTLISRVDKQQEQIRQLERKLKQAVSEQEHLSDHNTILTTEIDKHKSGKRDKPTILNTLTTVGVWNG
ncbi:Protein bicaudal D, partial [Geodia barretti]